MLLEITCGVSLMEIVCVLTVDALRRVELNAVDTINLSESSKITRSDGLREYLPAERNCLIISAHRCASLDVVIRSLKSHVA